MSSTKMITSVEDRDDFFNTHWADAYRKYVAMSLADRPESEKQLVQAIGHMMAIVSDMREIEMAYRAEIQSLQTLLKIKEQ